MLGNLYDFDPSKHMVAYSNLQEIDRWILGKLADIIEKVIKANDDYEFHVAYHAIHNFCTVELSAIYLDIVKDRAYVEGKDSVARRAAQTVMYEVLNALVRLLAPILVFTADEIWPYIPGVKEDSSVQTEEMPKVKPEWKNEELAAKWKKILNLRYDITKVLESARQAKIINHSLTAKVDLYPGDQETYEFLLSMEKPAEIVIVSEFAIHRPDERPPADAVEAESLAGLKIAVTSAPGQKCERCWMYSVEVGNNSVYPDLCPRCISVLETEAKGD